MPAIHRFSDEGFKCRLAISLHAPDDELRDTLVPVNTRWKVREVLDAGFEYAEKSGRRLSIEYALIRDINDQAWRGDRLGRLLRGRPVHVNLIPLNPTPGSKWTASRPEDEKARGLIGDSRGAVRGGAPLWAALDRQHGHFSRLDINMVRAGEAGGSVHGTLEGLGDYLERSRALKGRVVNALVYPAILLAMVGLSLLFLLGYVVPQFSAMYESLDADLPWFSTFVLGLGEFVRDWWIVILAVPLLALLWIDRKRRDPVFMRRFDGWLLQRKLAGPLVAKLDTARLARTLGTLLRNGVPWLSALGIAWTDKVMTGSSSKREQVAH